MHTTTGYKIISYEEVEHLRALAEKNNNSSCIVAQKGGQEKAFLSDADITIFGGCRGGGKSYLILLEALNDVYNPNFRAVIVRNEKNDLTDLIETSHEIFSSMGDYNKSKDDMTWNFHKGGFLRFDYYAGAFEDFKKRFQGKQFSYIAVDEITHIAYKKFKYLLTDNRNASGLRNRVIGTCNPDYYSWVYRFCRWWLDENGAPIAERDGVKRYCFMNGDNVDDIIWGDTREEVYLKCKDIIDSFYTDMLKPFGSPADLFVKSVCFIVGRLTDNIALMRSDPRYLSSLANQSEYERARDLLGLWVPELSGDDMISLTHLEQFFNNAIQKGDGVLRASCDVAFSGGDNLVLWLWEGNHIKDLFVARGIDSRSAIEQIRYNLDRWGVQQQNFTYDVSGIGQGLRGFYPKAIPFNNREAAVDVPKGTFDSIKSQCAFNFADRLINGEISINPDLLERKFSGTGFTAKTLREILSAERKIIRPDNSYSGRKLIAKADMKRVIGHSPDFIEALFMKEIFHLKKARNIKGLGLL